MTKGEAITIEINEHEINGRLKELYDTRNAALDRCVLLAGELGKLREENTQLKAQIKTMDDAALAEVKTP